MSRLRPGGVLHAGGGRAMVCVCRLAALRPDSFDGCLGNGTNAATARRLPSSQPCQVEGRVGQAGIASVVQPTTLRGSIL